LIALFLGPCPVNPSSLSPKSKADTKLCQSTEVLFASALRELVSDDLDLCVE
ncbi:translation initiation factor 3, subunit e, partial [Moesziomyces antarcticus T-34]